MPNAGRFFRRHLKLCLFALAAQHLLADGAAVARMLALLALRARASVRHALGAPSIRLLSTTASSSSTGTDEPAKLPVTYEQVARAFYLVRSGIVRSSLTHSETLSALCGCQVYLKRDFEQVCLLRSELCVRANHGPEAFARGV
jgi:hypothetical protein